jgi:pyruvate dehydrogenase E2 component (dihydrolipoamide acetyltransferase)
MSAPLEEFRMPSLGADMQAGRLTQWLKAPGDRLHRGDIIAEVDTDKGVIEVEVFADGILSEILVHEGERVPVGTVLALIRSEVEPAATPAAPQSGTATRPQASPLARRFAAERGIDLASLKGTGPGGVITLADVEAKAGTGPVSAPGADEATARMRRAIAAAMTRSKHEVPHYYLSTTIDVGSAVSWLAERNRDRPPKERLLLAVLQLKAVALALREFPELNSRWAEDRVVPSPGIHVGTAIALRGGGLIAPAIHHTDRLTLEALMQALADLAARARGGSLRSSELADSTITVTNLGERGVDAVLGIIYPPQVALVGFGRAAERPWVVGGQVIARPIVTATLSGDHRASDGHQGGLFLSRVEQLLQDPGRL